MKRVLVLAYDFPPLISIGAQRPNSWYKYLPEFGFAVTVVTRHWGGNINAALDYVKPTTSETLFERNEVNGSVIIRTAYKPNLRDRFLLKFGTTKLRLLRQAISFAYTFLEHLFFCFDSKRKIYFEAAKLLEKEHYDFIIATGEPFILFKYANKLSRKFSIPWIADYRDGWTTNQGNYELSMLQRLQLQFFRAMERKYIADATIIATAAPSYADALCKIHEGKNIRVVYNGYDDEVVNRITPSHKAENSEFIISYAGTVYPHQKIELFLEGFSLFLNSLPDEKKNQIRVKMFGVEGQTEVIHRINNSARHVRFIEILPRVDYKQLMNELKESSMLLLLSCKGANWLNAKVFDYLALKKPILLAENDGGILEKLIRENDAGYAAETAADVCNALLEEYHNFEQQAQSNLQFKNNYQTYSRKNQAKVLAGLLNSIKE